ncbi:MAG: hypothetical protein JXR46_02710 [Calditrichaceae bacterium]|nr:hypothetical protein [Calditrichaceae bacterium]MBN2707934.1 hypothetical protein [Calditrichaceae bacterium]RQV95371.1 MAG: hypothetical protein EH224_07785 [Calditrichota bacterium]
MKLLICLLLLIIHVLPGYSQNDSVETQIQLKTYLEETSVPLNREVVYCIELSWIGDLSRYRIVEPGDPVITNLELRRSGSSNRAYTDSAGNPRSVKTISYYFRPLEMGMAYIDGVVIRYEDRFTESEESLLANRLSAKIIEPVPENKNGGLLIKILIQLIVIIFILTVIYFVVKYFRQKKINQSAEQEVRLTLEDRFLERLEKELDHSKKTAKENLDCFSKIIFDYFNKKYSIPSAAGIYPVINKLTEDGVDESIINKLKQYSDMINLSRFAGENISESDLHLFIDTFEQLLNELNNRQNR